MMVFQSTALLLLVVLNYLKFAEENAGQVRYVLGIGVFLMEDVQQSHVLNILFAQMEDVFLLLQTSAAEIISVQEEVSAKIRDANMSLMSVQLQKDIMLMPVQVQGQMRITVLAGHISEQSLDYFVEY